MNDWLHNLPLAWMALTVFGATYLITAATCIIVAALADARRGRAFKAISPGMLPPLGILFALFVAFTAAQVWADTDRANTAVIHEASALRTVVILSAAFPDEPEAQLRRLVRRHIEDTATQEWPMMSRHTASLSAVPQQLAEAIRVSLALTPSSPGQEIAQRGIDKALEDALDARRQRVTVSLTQVNLAKWSCLIVQAICMLVAIAMVHSDNWGALAISSVLFASGVAVSIFLILAHDRPFAGEISVSPEPLLQVMPESPVR
jgi:hypothetical protein